MNLVGVNAKSTGMEMIANTGHMLAIEHLHAQNAKDHFLRIAQDVLNEQFGMTMQYVNVYRTLWVMSVILKCIEGVVILSV